MWEGASDGVFSKLHDLKKNGNIIVGYAGGLGFANAVHNLIDALHQVEDRVHVALLGDGPFRAEIEASVNKCGLMGRVHFFGRVEKAYVPIFLGLIDIAYLGLQDSALFEYGVSPTKLGDYMLAAKPVLAAFTDPEKVILKARCGVYCKPENSHDIARALTELSSLSEAQKEDMGQSGRRWVLSKRNYKDLARQFLELTK